MKKDRLIVDLAATIREGFTVVREPATLLDSGVARVPLQGGGDGLVVFDRAGLYGPQFEKRAFEKCPKDKKKKQG